MTVQEFKDQFNILYDGIASKGAPGLDDYEISVFLTLAQKELVKSKHNPKSNRLQEGFDQTSKRRVDLKNLLKDYKTSTTSNLNSNIEDNSKFFVIPKDVFLIEYEAAKLVDSCGSSNIVEVVPKTLDEYNIQRSNPFKKPYKKKVWRLDYNDYETGNNVVELISDSDILEYRLRYIKKPNPIIITNLTMGEFAGENLSIDGETAPQTSQLDSSVHDEILDRAVELATLSYKENNLNNLVNLNQRNE